MQRNAEAPSFFAEHKSQITWATLGVVLGAVGWEAVRRLLDKPQQKVHPYDKLDSKSRFKKLVAEPDIIRHY